jgi:hypothetical protein
MPRPSSAETFEIRPFAPDFRECHNSAVLEMAQLLIHAQDIVP